MNLYWFLCFKDVAAGYSQNELLFAYKNLMESRNGSSAVNGGDVNGSRNVTNADNSKRSSLSNEICKWIQVQFLYRPIRIITKN